MRSHEKEESEREARDVAGSPPPTGIARITSRIAHRRTGLCEATGTRPDPDDRRARSLRTGREIEPRATASCPRFRHHGSPATTATREGASQGFAQDREPDFRSAAFG